MKERKAVVAGHLCVDITPEFPDGFTGELSQVMQPGKLTNVAGISLSTGGVVANTGIAMKKLGIEVELMGKLARDELGQIAAARLAGYGASVNLSWSEDSNTSYTMVVALPGCDRIFLHSPGANDTFGADDLDMESISQASLFHFGYPPLMRRMYEEDGKELIRIFRRVSEAGTAASLDMAAVDPLAPAGKADWEKILEQVLPYTDIFVPSAEELLYMLDREKFLDLNRRADGQDVTRILSIEQDIQPLGQRLLEMGAGMILIKCGVSGLYYRTGSSGKLSGIGEKLGFVLKGWAEREGFERSYVPQQVLSGTGAGDATIAAFLASMLREYSLEQSVRYAAAEGASCVEAYDALGGLRTLEEIQEKIAAGWEKQIF